MKISVCDWQGRYQSQNCVRLYVCEFLQSGLVLKKQKKHKNQTEGMKLQKNWVRHDVCEVFGRVLV